MTSANRAISDARHRSIKSVFASVIHRAVLSGAFQLSIANILSAIAQFTILLVIVRTSDEATVGQYGAALAIVTPLLMLTGLQLQVLVSTDVGDRFSPGSIFILRASGVLISGLVLWLAVHFFESLRTLSFMLLLIFALRSIESFGDVTHGFMLRAGHIGAMARCLIVRGITQTLVVSFICGLGLSVGFALSCCIFFTLIVVLSLDIRHFIRHESGTSKKSFDLRIHEVLMISLPLGMVLSLNSLNQYIPRMILQQSGTLEQVGIFTALASLMRIGSLFETAITASATPKIARLLLNGQTSLAVTQVIKILCFVAIGGVVSIGVTVLSGHQILSHIYSPTYAQERNSLIVLMIAAALGYLAGVMKSAADAFHAFKVQVILMVISVVISTGFGYILIPTGQVLGASLTILVMKATLLVGYIVLCISLFIRHKRSCENA